MSKILNKVIIGKIMIHKVEKIQIVLHNEKACKISPTWIQFLEVWEAMKGFITSSVARLEPRKRVEGGLTKSVDRVIY